MKKVLYIIIKRIPILSSYSPRKKKIIKSTENILIGYYTQSHRVFRRYRRHIYYNGRCVCGGLHTCVLWTCYTEKLSSTGLISILMVPEIYNHRETLNITFSAPSHTHTYTSSTKLWRPYNVGPKFCRTSFIYIFLFIRFSCL